MHGSRKRHGCALRPVGLHVARTSLRSPSGREWTTSRHTCTCPHTRIRYASSSRAFHDRTLKIHGMVQQTKNPSLSEIPMRIVPGFPAWAYVEESTLDSAVRENRDAIRRTLRAHGAVVLRGDTSAGAPRFAAATAALGLPVHEDLSCSAGARRGGSGCVHGERGAGPRFDPRAPRDGAVRPPARRGGLLL